MSSRNNIDIFWIWWPLEALLNTLLTWKANGLSIYAILWSYMQSIQNELLNVNEPTLRSPHVRHLRHPGSAERHLETVRTRAASWWPCSVGGPVLVHHGDCPGPTATPVAAHERCIGTGLTLATPSAVHPSLRHSCPSWSTRGVVDRRTPSLPVPSSAARSLQTKSS